MTNRTVRMVKVGSPWLPGKTAPRWPAGKRLLAYHWNIPAVGAFFAVLLSLSLMVAMGSIWETALAQSATKPSFPWLGAAAEAQESLGHVHALVIPPNVPFLYLGTHNGLYRSADEGKSWRRVSFPGPQDAMAVVVHPKRPEEIYVGGHDLSVIKSVDGGSSWKPVGQGLGGTDVHGLALDAYGPTEKLYAYVQEVGLYRSTNGGTSWQRMDDGPPGGVSLLSAVNIPSGMGGILLFAGSSSGLYYSPDCF